ncbi:MAG: COX15/CtaA family protein [Anaerolineae bacterium]
MIQNSVRSNWFIRFSLLTAALTLGLIVFGAVVRVTDSGLGCGNHWPLCNGSVIPPLDNITAWIEWLHRLFAILIGLFGIVMLVLAVRGYRTHNRLVLGFTVLAALLYTVQSLLGAVVVKLDLPPTMVTLHLGNAMLLLASLLLAGMFAVYRPGQSYASDRVTTMTYVTAALSLVIILTGALVRSSGATLACTDWPLCNGAIFPGDQGQLALVHMVHRYAVTALGISLLVLLIYVYRDRTNPRVRSLALAALMAYLAQAAVGAMFVMSRAGAGLGALHVGLAATTWGLLVILATIVVV